METYFNGLSINDTSPVYTTDRVYSQFFHRKGTADFMCNYLNKISNTDKHKVFQVDGFMWEIRNTQAETVTMNVSFDADLLNKP